MQPPVTIHARLLEREGKWDYEVKVWEGDVDITMTAPTKTVVSRQPTEVRSFAAETILHDVAYALGVQNR